jgi:hypothetical protein
MRFDVLKNKLCIRAAEVDLIRRYLAPQSRVLELGGGNGWQAKQIASWGFEIEAIDIEAQTDLHHSVALYDGVTIPFPAETFDVIFSSNVLEHIEMRATLFTDMKRVLKLSGYMIHIVPSASWRLWTALAHYLHVVRRLVRTAFPVMPINVAREHAHRGIPRRQVVTIFDNLRKSILPAAHGIDGSVFRELITFSRWGWRACFRDAELSIFDEYRTGIFYTGYRLLPWMGIGPRKFLANFLGSSCHVFILRFSSASCPRRAV